jgi:hypothetical protein
MDSVALSQTQEKAAAGDVAAQLALAQHYDAEGRSDEARHWLERAANAGNVDALAALGELFLLRPGMPVMDGIKLTLAAAERGSAKAAHQAAVFFAVGGGVPQSWNTALDYLQRAAELGLPLAREQLALFSSNRKLVKSIALSSAPDIWSKLRQSADADLFKAVPVSRQVLQSPRVWEVPQFLPPSYCAWLIARAKPRVERAQVYSPSTGGATVEQARSNSFVDFNIVETDLVIALARARISAVTGLALAGLEHTAVLHYTVGQEFLPHFDFLDTENPAYAEDLARRGQRVATFLLYLNGDFDGGETGFPLVNWKFKGGAGDAMFFSNVDVTGAPDRQTRHAGLPPRRGEKWLLSQFIRAPYVAKR